MAGAPPFRLKIIYADIPVLVNIWNYPPPHLIRILISTDDDDTGGDDDDDDEGLTEAGVVFSIFVDDTPVCFTLAEARSTS